MNMTFSMIVLGLIAGLFKALIPIALLVILQVWLCRKSLKLGVILPVLSLLTSLLLVLGLAGFTALGAPNSGKLTLEENGSIVEQKVYQDGMVTVYNGSGELIDQYPDSNGDPHPNQRLTSGATVAAICVFLVANIPTVVFGGIWLHYKGLKNTHDSLKRMQIEDLG